ncbi:hypothetical protein B4113_3314 [Geobacillus sp. B4113_201601]|nr:hypothetical protein B4113_3314 [Geobacillus sp. B4113_201601]
MMNASFFLSRLPIARKHERQSGRQTPIDGCGILREITGLLAENKRVYRFPAF